MNTSEKTSYQRPPKVIAELVDAPQAPVVRFSPTRDKILLLTRLNLPPIEELSQGELRLGGLRINPQTNSSSRNSYYTKIKVMSIDDKIEHDILNLPVNPKIENISWSPDSSKIAFTNKTTNGIELWMIMLDNYTATKITEAIINSAMSGPCYEWFPNSQSILYKSIPANRGTVVPESQIPTGPIIQESREGKTPLKTYQDLLKTPYDKNLFDYYTSAQLMCYHLESATHSVFGSTGIIKGFTISPDGNFVIVSAINRPYSYIVPYSRFPSSIFIFDKKGKEVKKIVDIPLLENIPNSIGAVRKEPRSFHWRSDQPATLVWVVAQDGGDPRKKVPIRDQLYSLSAPFDTTPEEGITYALRYGGISWGNDQIAMTYEWEWQSRRIITSQFTPGDKDSKEIIFDRSIEDDYSHPGHFEKCKNEYGQYSLLITKNNTLYLRGQGASPEGNRPFVDTFDSQTKKTSRIWQSESPYYEYPLAIVDEEKSVVLTRRQSIDEPSNYFLRSMQSGQTTPITHFKNPYKALKGVKKELIKYKRADGVELTAKLYLPAGYDKEKDGRLPALMWSYPKEYKSKAAAGQVKSSPYEFIQIAWPSPLFWVTRGYAVLDNFAMPIIGEGEEEPNETFVSQLISGAEAAIDKLDKMGVVDRNRLAVGGHSYGAFMAANLLVYTDLFAAGIARSGAYNRTLTPFGFQYEERSFWEASDTYFKMSPFMHADKIKNPLLLIHGAADSNTGTYPMQSERFYAALKGHGAPVRLVMLPHESHSYQAYESIMHMLWEMDTWLEEHVKNKK